jgi:hypothetical protein
LELPTHALSPHMCCLRQALDADADRLYSNAKAALVGGNDAGARVQLEAREAVLNRKPTLQADADAAQSRRDSKRVPAAGSSSYNPNPIDNHPPTHSLLGHVSQAQAPPTLSFPFSLPLPLPIYFCTLCLQGYVRAAYTFSRLHYEFWFDSLLPLTPPFHHSPLPINLWFGL